MVIDEKDLLGMQDIGTKFQITLPKKVRDQLKLKVGDTVLLVLKDGEVIIKKQ